MVCESSSLILRPSKRATIVLQLLRVLPMLVLLLSASVSPTQSPIKWRGSTQAPFPQAFPWAPAHAHLPSEGVLAGRCNARGHNR